MNFICHNTTIKVLTAMIFRYYDGSLKLKNKKNFVLKNLKKVLTFIKKYSKIVNVIRMIKHWWFQY